MVLRVLLVGVRAIWLAVQMVVWAFGLVIWEGRWRVVWWVMLGAISRVICLEAWQVMSGVILQGTCHVVWQVIFLEVW